MLLLKESVDDAVVAPSAFYDIRNGNFVCDSKKHAELLYKHYNLLCELVRKDDIEANDRVVMAAQFQLSENELHSYVQAAMGDLNQDTSDYNHPVGY
ncbi:hypothetical protein Aduo_001039 [Ancylostoma duodenale]